MHSSLTSTSLFCTCNFIPTHHKYLKHANAFAGVDKFNYLHHQGRGGFWFRRTLSGLRPTPAARARRGEDARPAGPAPGWTRAAPNPSGLWAGARRENQPCVSRPTAFLTGWVAATRRHGHLLWFICYPNCKKSPIRGRQGEKGEDRNSLLYQYHFSCC